MTKVTNTYRLTPRDCPHCGRFMDEEFLKKKLAEVSQSKSKGMKKYWSELEDRRMGGRRRMIDRELIRELRKNGLIIRDIAKQVGCSIGSVSVALKEKP